MDDLKPVNIEALNRSGGLVFPPHFFVHTYHSELLEEHLVGPGYDFFGKWREWLMDNRIFVERKKVTINKDNLV
jgi:hypothetical protein